MILPTPHDRAFIPYQLGSDSKFEACLPNTLQQEGGYSNDAHDPGGMTMEGIIQREYDAKRKQWGLPTRWVRDVTGDELRTIYYTDYWLPYATLLPAGLDLEFFDLNVNAGQHRAIVTLQRALRVSDDGQFGPQTWKVVHDCQLDPTIKRFRDEREKFYRSISGFRFFGKDWIRRSEEIEQEAEKMETQPKGA